MVVTQLELFTPQYALNSLSYHDKLTYEQTDKQTNKCNQSHISLVGHIRCYLNTHKQT